MSLVSNILAFIQLLGTDYKALNQRVAALEQDILTRKKKDQFIDGTINLDFPNIPAGTTTVAIQGTIAGAASGDRVVIGNSSNKLNGVKIDCTITGSGANNALFVASNMTLADVNPANGTYRYTILKPNDFS